MSILPDEDRANITTDFMRKESITFEGFGNFFKDNLRSAINAIDDWIDNNVVSFNTSIPEPCKSELTQKQKVRLFMFVIKRRWEVE